MPMIWETTSSGFLNAMNGAFEAAYSAASDPRISNNPLVIRALAAAKSAHADAIEAASVADAASGFFQSIKAGRNASKAAYLASTAEGKLRSAIEEAKAVADTAKFNGDTEHVAAELYRTAVLEEVNSLKLADVH